MAVMALPTMEVGSSAGARPGVMPERLATHAAADGSPRDCHARDSSPARPGGTSLPQPIPT